MLKMNIFNENLYKKLRKSIGTINAEFSRDWKLYEDGKKEMDYKMAVKFANIHYSIKLVNVVLDNIKDKLDYSEGDLLHGSRKGIKGNIIPKSADTCDFGKAFYIGNNFLQVLTLVSHEPNATIYKFRIKDYNKLKVLKFDANLEWALFVLANRKYMDSDLLEKYYKSLSSMYDIIVGPIADDRLFETMNSFSAGILFDETFLKILKDTNLGIQYACRNMNSCKKLEIVCSYKLTEIEKAILNRYQSDRVKNTNNKVNEIIDEYGNIGKRVKLIIEQKEKEVTECLEQKDMILQ